MLQYRVDPRTKEGAFFNPRPTEKAVPAQYGVYLHGTDTYWHRTVGPNFLIDLGNWPTEKDAEAFVEHLKANGPDSSRGGRELEYVVVDERILGYRKPPEQDASFSTVQILAAPGSDPRNNQYPIQHDLNRVRPATAADFARFRVELGEHEKYLTRPLEALYRHYPLTIAGTEYRHDTTPGMIPTRINESGEKVSSWEIWQYLVSGKLTPPLAADAVTHWQDLDRFDRASLYNFAMEARRDPTFREYLEYENQYYRAANNNEDYPMRQLRMADIPELLQDFVRNPYGEKFMNDKQSLETFFGNEATFGIRRINDATGETIPDSSPDGRQVLFNDGSAVQGMSYAEAVRDILPGQDVRIAGFYSKDNPASAYAHQWHEEGADFAVIHQNGEPRYLVDPWPKFTCDSSLPVVYDLRTDQAKVQEIYGDPQKWEFTSQNRPDTIMVQRAKDLGLSFGLDYRLKSEGVDYGLFLANEHIRAIANHPAVERFSRILELPEMTPSAIETYGKVLLSNNPDLSEHISGFRKQMEQIASVGGIKPTEPKFVVIGQAIDQLPANFGKDALFDAMRVATIEPPKATMKP